MPTGPALAVAAVQLWPDRVINALLALFRAEKHFP